MHGRLRRSYFGLIFEGAAGRARRDDAAWAAMPAPLFERLGRLAQLSRGCGQFSAAQRRLGTARAGPAGPETKPSIPSRAGRQRSQFKSDRPRGYPAGPAAAADDCPRCSRMSVPERILAWIARRCGIGIAVAARVVVVIEAETAVHKTTPVLETSLVAEVACLGKVPTGNAARETPRARRGGLPPKVRPTRAPPPKPPT